jgi:hypothetical protein
MDQLRVAAFLSESDLSPRRAVGTPVAIQWQEGLEQRAKPEQLTLRGKIVAIDPQMLSDQTYRVIVMIENRRLDGGWLLVPGRSVTMSVYPEQVALAKPSGAQR